MHFSSPNPNLMSSISFFTYAFVLPEVKRGTLGPMMVNGGGFAPLLRIALRFTKRRAGALALLVRSDDAETARSHVPRALEDARSRPLTSPPAQKHTTTSSRREW